MVFDVVAAAGVEFEFEFDVDWVAVDVVVVVLAFEVVELLFVVGFVEVVAVTIVLIAT